MIRINLAPYEETENPYWWVIDAVVLVVVFALTYSAVNAHFATIKDEIDLHARNAERHQLKYKSLKDDLARVKELEDKKNNLNGMRHSVRKITNSKLTKYLPIILVEHIQNLKPEGVWLTSLSVVTGSDEKPAEKKRGREESPASQIKIQGNALDNIILAEFMTQLKATRNQEADPADLRTKVFFKDINIVFADLIQEPLPGTVAGVFDAMKFELSVKYDERHTEDQVNKEISEIINTYRLKNKAKL